MDGQRSAAEGARLTAALPLLFLGTWIYLETTGDSFTPGQPARLQARCDVSEGRAAEHQPRQRARECSDVHSPRRQEATKASRLHLPAPGHAGITRATPPGHTAPARLRGNVAQCGRLLRTDSLR